MARIRETTFPVNWRILIHILGLYRDLNNALQNLGKSDVDFERDIKRIIGRLKAINTIGRNISWYFFVNIPTQLLLDSNEYIRTKKNIKRTLLALRSALEKMIISRGSFRLIRRKDTNIDLHNPAISMFVPSDFESIIPNFEYIPGRKPILLSAPHAKGPSSDPYTEYIARKVSEKTHAHALISSVSRLNLDPNRIIGRISPYRQLLDKLAWELKVRFIIDLHSMRRHRENLVEIGTWYGLSISRKYLDMLTSLFEAHSIPYDISTRYVGGDIVFYHANRPLVSAVQLEISRYINRKMLHNLVKSLIKFVNFIGERK